MTAFFLTVPQDVARNPVARAIGQQRMTQALRDFAVVLYGLPNGSVQTENLSAAAHVLAVGVKLAEAQGKPDHIQAMSDAIGLIAARSADGFRWLSADAADIDIGMAAALQVLTAASAVQVQQAWQVVNEGATA